MNTITERDILAVNDVTINVATSGAPSHPVNQGSRPVPPLEFWVSGQLITLPHASGRSVSVFEQLAAPVVSPTWLGRVKNRLKDLARLPANWDSYGASPVDPRITPIAEELVEWFAVEGIPPPDVFATVEGGMQLEWHIRRVNVEIELSPFEETTIRFHDLNTGEPWSRPASSTDLQIVRRRLLAKV